MFIYKITNIISNKLYFGQTISKPSVRWSGHKCAAFTQKINCPLYNSMRKYGIDNFSFEVIDTNAKTLEQLNNLEEFYILHWNTTDRSKGYNVKLGGNNNILTDEVKNKISASLLGKLKTTEHKLKMSNAHKGIPLSDEHKQSLSKMHLGKSMSHKGKPWSEDRRKAQDNKKKR